MRTDIAALAGSPLLGGSIPGRALFAEFAKLAQSRPTEPTAWLWDFGGIEAASASFIRESFLSTSALLRAQRSHLVPVIVNANPDVREDLDLFLKASGAAMLAATTRDDATISHLELIGAVDAHLQSTFALVTERRETDARELKELTDAQPDAAPIVQTAWNNRLAKLVEMGALIELTRGRTKRYRAII